MKLTEGSVLYVRIDYKAEKKEATNQDAQDSMDYLQSIAKERYLLAGVFGDLEFEDINGAMILFEAKDLEEAQKIAHRDPIIERGFYRCEIYRWNLMLLSECSCE